MSGLLGNLGGIVLAASILGAASYGLVDCLKFFSWFDLSGFENLFSGSVGGRRWPTKQKANLDQLFLALKAAYGENTMNLLMTQYRANRVKGDLLLTLNRGFRFGFSKMTEEQVICTLLNFGIDGATAHLAAEAIKKERKSVAGETPLIPVSGEAHDAKINVLTMIDKRIKASLYLANNQFATQNKVLATLISLLITSAGAAYLDYSKLISDSQELQLALAVCALIGITAVPLAPIGKDMGVALLQ